MSGKKQVRHHITHSMSLLGLLLVALVGILSFWYGRSFQIAIAVSVAFAYFMWGVVHHSLHKELRPIIIFEYFMVAILGMIVLLSLIMRS